jgi:hypothetical protein
MALHKNATAPDNHVVHSLVYADATARGAATFAATDVGRIALQLDDSTFWILKEHSPAVWGTITAGAVPVPGGAPVDVTKAAADAGASTDYARADHKHDVATASATGIAPGGSSTEGSSTSLARADHTHSLPAFGAALGTFCQGNDARLSDARVPTGSAGGQLGGSYPNPDVRGLRETSGPTLLTVGPITDGQALVRSGASITSAAIPAAISPGGAPANVTKAAAAAGVSVDYARADHKHDVTTAAPSTALTATTTNAEGVATSLARSDHTHAITTGVAGNIAPNNVNGAGTAASLARSDHTHALPVAAPVALTVGGANAAGVANTTCRSDHTHALPAFGSTAGTFCQGNDARLSDSRTPTGAAGGQLGGAYPNPDVRGLRETSGPTALTIGPIADGEALVRSGASITSAAIPAAISPGGAPVDVTKAAAAAGVAATYARSDHKHDITTAAPSTALTAATTNAEGAATSLARSDHTHAITTAAPVALTVGGANAAGVAASLCRSDHTHALPAFGTTAGTFCEGNDSRLSDSRPPTGAAGGQLGGTYPNPDVRGLRETSGPTLLTLGAVADGQLLVRSGSTIVGTAAGVVPTPGGAPVNVTKAAASAGVAATYSRSDHKHDVSTAAPGTSLSATTTNAEGTATSLARSDHTHAITTAAPIALTVGGSNAAGTATTLCRSDHTHALPAFGTTAGTFCQGNDARLSDARTPTGAAGGQLGGTYPNPDVRGLRETSGPTNLTMGAVADLSLLSRSGSTLVGVPVPVFGTQLTTADDESTSTTTSTTFQTKLTLTTNNLPAGVYIIFWNYYWAYSSTANSFEARVLRDGSAVEALHREEPQDTSLTQARGHTGLDVMSLAAGVHTFDLQYRNTAGGNTAQIEHVHMVFYRLS